MYTADRLIGFGYTIDATCFCSTALDTPSHLFFFLPSRTKRPVLASVSYVLLLLLLPVSCLSSVCRFAPRGLRSFPKVIIYVLTVCKFFIWDARNDFRVQGFRLGAPQLIAKVRSRVGFHLSLLFKRYKSLRRRRMFRRRWGAAGIIGSVVDDRFVLSSF